MDGDRGKIPENKRKVEDTSFEEIDPFRKSKKIERSPPGKMEEIKNMISNLMAETKEIRKENAEGREEMKALKEEIKALKEEMMRRETIWMNEKKVFEEKIQVVEKTIEEQEKKERRNNIILRGINCRRGEEKQQVQEFMENVLKVDVKIREAFALGNKNLILAKIDNWEEKKKIMRGKKILREKMETRKMFIDNDLTKKERETQKQIVGIAKQYKEEGRNIKIGYMKIKIDDDWLKWDDNKKKLIQAKN